MFHSTWGKDTGRQPKSADVISAHLASHGLSLRGGFNFDVDDDAPNGASGRQAKAVLLVGNIGAAFWPHFQKWLKTQAMPLENPLDEWSRQVIGMAGDLVGARTVMPNDRPFLPFQQWAMRAESLRPSPVGVLMHPEYGLWHAYRGALLFDTKLPCDEIHDPIHLCDQCLEKPCIKACPVRAHTPAGFAYERCLEYVRRESGQDCGSSGCLDRNACPFGTQFRYPPVVQKFFMDAFAR